MGEFWDKPKKSRNNFHVFMKVTRGAVTEHIPPKDPCDDPSLGGKLVNNLFLIGIIVIERVGPLTVDSLPEHP